MVVFCHIFQAGGHETQHRITYLAICHLRRWTKTHTVSLGDCQPLFGPFRKLVALMLGHSRDNRKRQPPICRGRINTKADDLEFTPRSFK